jgi:hypothetical protein
MFIREDCYEKLGANPNQRPGKKPKKKAKNI